MPNVNPKTVLLAILSDHVPTTVSHRNGNGNGTVTHNEVCAACGHAFPWDRTEREQAVRDHHATLIATWHTEQVNAATADQREVDLAMHLAFRPEAVAEVAVHLGSHEDWDHIAAWCGGRIENVEDASGSGEYSSQIVLPDGQVASERSWLTLAHDGKFHVRAVVQAPDVAIPAAPQT